MSFTIAFFGFLTLFSLSRGCYDYQFKVTTGGSASNDPLYVSLGSDGYWTSTSSYVFGNTGTTYTRTMCKEYIGEIDQIRLIFFGTDGIKITGVQVNREGSFISASGSSKQLRNSNNDGRCDRLDVTLFPNAVWPGSGSVVGFPSAQAPTQCPTTASPTSAPTCFDYKIKISVGSGASTDPLYIALGSSGYWTSTYSTTLSSSQTTYSRTICRPYIGDIDTVRLIFYGTNGIQISGVQLFQNNVWNVASGNEKQLKNSKNDGRCDRLDISFDPVPQWPGSGSVLGFPSAEAPTNCPTTASPTPSPV